MKKVISILISLALLLPSALYAESVNVDNHKGLQLNPQADKIEDSAHARFQNVYVKDNKITVIKGRDKINTTALADVVVNMACYYENSAGTTKKLLIRNSNSLVSYNLDLTSPTTLIGSLANERADCVQVSDLFYMESVTDGLIKWTGTGSATVVSNVSAPSSVTPATSTTAGGLTPGQAIQVTPILVSDPSCSIPTTATVATSCTCISDTAASCSNAPTLGQTNVSTSTFIFEELSTSSSYSYKRTNYSTVLGVESEASSGASISLTGDNLFSWSADNCLSCDTVCNSGGSGCNNGSDIASCCTGIDYITSGERTSTSLTLGSAPSAPFNSYRIYRTVAGGSDYFLLGSQASGTYTDGKPDNTLGVALDTTIDTISPPKSRLIEEYKGTLIIGNGSSIRYSTLSPTDTSDADTYWLETDQISTGSVKELKGMASTSNSLILCSENAIYELTGFGVDSFRLSRIAKGLGCVSDEAIEEDTDGNLIFFAGKQGVYKLSTGQQQQDDLSGAVLSRPSSTFTRVSSPALEDVFNGTNSVISLDTTTYANSHAYYDKVNDLYWLYIQDYAFVFNNRNAQWSYIPASKAIASVYAPSVSSEDSAVVFDDLGMVYKNFKGYENGVHSGTVTGSPTSSSASTLVDSTAAFNTTGSGLKGVWIYVDNEIGEFHQIISNTATTITIADTWEVEPVISDKYYVGYIVVSTLSKQYSLNKAPDKVRTNYFSVVHNKSSASTDLDLFFYRSKDVEANSLYTINLATNLIDKLNVKMESPWIQWEQRAFIYNTSDSIVPPVDIVSYKITYSNVEEQ